MSGSHPHSGGGDDPLDFFLDGDLPFHLPATDEEFFNQAASSSHPQVFIYLKHTFCEDGAGCVRPRCVRARHPTS